MMTHNVCVRPRTYTRTPTAPETGRGEKRNENRERGGGRRGEGQEENIDKKRRGGMRGRETSKEEEGEYSYQVQPPGAVEMQSAGRA